VEDCLSGDHVRDGSPLSGKVRHLDWKNSMYQRIVVPLDGSDLAEKSLIHAETLASLTGAPVHLVRVVETLVQIGEQGYGAIPGSSDLADYVAEETDAAREYLAAVVESLLRQGIAATSEVRYGQIAPQLVEASCPGDIYVLASHGRSGIARWFLGSIAEEVIRRSTAPVMLIRSASTAAKDRSLKARVFQG
jgi:nucleotide-binding universal stress UspA family protein